VIAFAAGCVFVSGCGQSGPAMHHISGSITFDGKPIESGRIDFLPDPEKKNDGPQGFAFIKSGKYDTRNEGQGHAGGPIIVRIEGFDGKTDNPKWFGNRIFAAYDIPADLPKKDSEQSFDVPASAAKKPVSKAANPKS
jgi:hypothetical protein